MLKIDKYYDELPWLAEQRGRLTELLASGRCPHGLLVYGRSGTGRRHLALWLAEAMLGLDPQRMALAGEDEPDSVHPDLHVIEPEEDKQTISVTIIIPKELVPYYHWLMDFPGWREPRQSEPPHPIPIRKGYQSVTPIYNLMTVLKPAGNDRRIKSQ